LKKGYKDQVLLLKVAPSLKATGSIAPFAHRFSRLERPCFA